MDTYFYEYSAEAAQPATLADARYDGGNNLYYGMDCVAYPSPSPTDQVACQLTPPAPATPYPSPEAEEGETETISISTAFNLNTHINEPDIVFSSSDGVLFYADTQILTKASPNAFQALISTSSSPEGGCENHSGSIRIVPVQETSLVLNIILHALYGTSCAQHSPMFETLVEAINHMSRYDISPATHITRSSHLYEALLAYAPLYPLELYALSARFKFHDLAVATSSHLLSCSLSAITDDMVEIIGPIYLKRLYDLHLTRFSALRDMLLAPPHPHPPTKDCNFSDQQGLTRAWALVAAYLAWDARADLSTHSLKLAFSPLIDHLSCGDCKESLRLKLHDVVVKWASVKRTV